MDSELPVTSGTNDGDVVSDAEALKVEIELVVAMVESLVRDGTIATVDRSDEEVSNDIAAAMAELVELSAPDSDKPMFFAPIVDYRSELLSEAARYADSGRFNFSIVFYAILVEHWLNSMLITQAERRGFDDALSAKLVRGGSIDTKTGYLWTLLFEHSLPEQIVQQIKLLAEQRNTFVHYKWRAVVDAEAAQRQAGDTCGAARQLIADLDGIEEALFFANERDRVREIVENQYFSDR